MDAIRASNFLVNSLMLPGMFLESSYTYDDFPYMDLMATTEQRRLQDASRPNYVPKVKYTDKVIVSKYNITYPLRLIFIPVDYSTMPIADRLLNSPGTHVPAVLQIANRNKGSTFIIHFHGNACDAAQVGAPARVESRMFNAHYLVVEYPGYGIAHGASSETMLNSIAFSAYLYVIKTLGVSPDKVVIYGRSVGCGLAVSLAAKLQTLGHPPAALILHSPYTSIRDVAKDVMGKSTLLFMNRWENWRPLCQKPLSVTATAPSKAPVKPSSGTDTGTTAETGGGDVDSESIQVTMAASAAKEPEQGHGHAMTAAEVRSLPARFAACAPTSIEAPVLFIHADHDQIIDHHHSATLNLSRSRNGLSSELFTQRSNEIFHKDHNMFDYEVDVINPIRSFLTKHLLLSASASGGSEHFFRRPSLMSTEYDDEPETFVSLNLSDVTSATRLPRQYLMDMLQVRSDRERMDKKNAEKAAAEAAAEAKVAQAAAAIKQKQQADTRSSAGSPSSDAVSTETGASDAVDPIVKQKEAASKDGAGSLLGLICAGWNIMKCIRCCVCCVPCFCCECHCSCCSAACNGIYYTLFDDEPDFEYNTKAQRRQSGGLQIPENRNSITDRSSIGTLHTTQPPTIQEPTEMPPSISQMDRDDDNRINIAEADDRNGGAGYATSVFENNSASERVSEKVETDTVETSGTGVGSPSSSCGSSIATANSTTTSIAGFFSRPFDQPNSNATNDHVDVMENIGKSDTDDDTLNPLQNSEGEPKPKPTSGVPMYLPG